MFDALVCDCSFDISNDEYPMTLSDIALGYSLASKIYIAKPWQVGKDDTSEYLRLREKTVSLMSPTLLLSTKKSTLWACRKFFA
jgi:hypothetical protein